MASLIVGGVTIPVAPGGISRPRLDLVDRARAFDGTYRASATGNPKREWHFSTPPIKRQLADFYERKLSIVTAQVCSGDIIGGSRNGWTRSEEFDHADWSKQNVTVTANILPAPDGTTTLDRVLETATTATHGVYRTTPALTANTAQASSVFAVGTGRTWMMIQTFDKAGVSKQSWINLSTGVAGTTAAGHTISAELYPDGWYRVGLLWNSASGGSAPEVAFFIASADNVSSYLGDITKGLFLWGAQHDTDRATISSYAPTTTAAVDTLSPSCCSEFIGWTPVRTAVGHSVVGEFSLHEV